MTRKGRIQVLCERAKEKGYLPATARELYRAQEELLEKPRDEKAYFEKHFELDKQHRKRVSEMNEQHRKKVSEMNEQYQKELKALKKAHGIYERAYSETYFQDQLNRECKKNRLKRRKEKREISYTTIKFAGWKNKKTGEEIKMKNNSDWEPIWKTIKVKPYTREIWVYDYE